MREYFTIEHLIEVPRSRRVKQAYSDWIGSPGKYETLEEAIKETKDSSGKARITKHIEEVVWIQ